MKNIIIILAITLASILKLSAAGYEETMGQNIAKLFQTQNSEELISIANTFDRIGQKEASQWLPYYYAAYANLSVLFFNQDLSVDEKIKNLDLAQKELDKAATLNENESEIYVLQAFIYQMRITDPSLGYKYLTLSNESLAKAKTLTPENPRYYYLKGMNVFYTPSEFGGGKEAAKPMLEKAAELFAKATQENPLLPSWGKEHNQMMLQQCN